VISGVQIRTVGERDVPAVAGFQTSCWQQVYRGVVPDSYLDSMDLQSRTVTWRERVVSGQRHVAAAWSDAAVVGVVSWTADASPQQVDELNTLYVSVALHGTGLAGELLAVALGTRAARLWVFEANNQARRFYGKHGFAATGAAQVDPGTGVWELELARPAAIEEYRRLV
jgi:GNAT superfamily N-acetyltransferase